MGCGGPPTGKVIVLLVFLVQHRCRDVWNVATRITFTGDIYLVVLDAKGLFKVLEEFDKVLGSLLLGLGGDFANREASADGLLNPKSHVSHHTDTPNGGKTYHSIFVRFTHELDHVRTWFRIGRINKTYYGFSTGANVPGCHRNLPFSWKKPSKELQPGPPFNQIVISSTCFPMVGLNMKNKALEAFFSSIGINPEYISPMSKLTSGNESILYSASCKPHVRWDKQTGTDWM